MPLDWHFQFSFFYKLLPTELVYCILSNIQYYMTQEKEKQNARLLLFADFSVSPEKALLFLKDMDDNPQKVTRYSQLLSQNLSKQYETIKEMSLEELRIMTKERAKDWASQIGPVTTQEYVCHRTRQIQNQTFRGFLYLFDAWAPTWQISAQKQLVGMWPQRLG